MKHLTVISLLVALITSCSGGQIGPKSIDGSTMEVGQLANERPNVSDNGLADSKSRTKVYNGITYSVNLINAVDFVSRKGEKLELSERLELSKECVAILKIDLKNSKETSVFESSKMTMNREDAMQYLVGQISNDFSVEQNGESISPLGVEYDAGIAQPDNIKIFLFFNKINLDKSSSVVYYDRLFGAGLIRFNLNNRKQPRS